MDLYFSEIDFYVQYNLFNLSYIHFIIVTQFMYKFRLSFTFFNVLIYFTVYLLINLYSMIIYICCIFNCHNLFAHNY